MAWAAAALTLQIFAGHPQFALYTLLIFLVLRIFRKTPVAAWVRAGEVMAGAAALSAVQWIPFLGFWIHTPRAARAGNLAWSGVYSLAPREFVKMALLPQWNGEWSPGSGDPHIVGFYMGVLALGMAVLGFAAKKGKGGRSLMVMALVGLVLAFGRHAPGFGLLHRVPPFSLFRFPAQGLVLTTLGLSLAAGIGLDRLSRRKLQTAVIAACLFDLWMFSLKAVEVVDRDVYEKSTSTGRFLRSLPTPGRVLLAPKSRVQTQWEGTTKEEAWERARNSLMPNVAMAEDLEDVDGYEEMRYASYDALLDRLGSNPRSPWLSLLGVRYILSREALRPGLFKFLKRDDIFIYENAEAFPRAYVATAVRRAADAELAKDVESLQLSTLRHTVFFTSEGGVDPPSGSATAGAPVEWVRPTPNRLRLDGTTPVKAWVVVGESYDPGWRATVNGVPAPIVRANGGMRAVQAPAGDFHIEFAYRPPLWRLAVALSGAAGVVLAILGLGAALGRRRPGDFTALKSLSRGGRGKV